MIPRNEHPKPQFMRENWQNLNGTWAFEIDNEVSGYEKGFYNEGIEFSKEITVPFCPESELSGINNTDFMNAVWYKKKVNIKKTDELIFLHIGAADYKTTIFVNGKKAGEHVGGYVSFYQDITDKVVDGENEICIYCEDPIKTKAIPKGKQSHEYKPRGCIYTRTTGIWQTVWLEYVPQNYVKSVKYYPNISDSSVTVAVSLVGKADFSFVTTYEGNEMGSHFIKEATGEITFTVNLKEKHLWQVGKGRLYDVELSFGKDKVTSYFGLRQVRLDGMKFLINEESVFQRLVLDQGFYPDGICTAPTDEALEKDILLSLKAGFNGARLHQKVFEERFLYHADKHGYIVWGEYASWGLDNTDPNSIYAILPEWIAEINRDFNHPSIIGWCPYNETYAWNLKGFQYDDAVKMVYEITKSLDPTRPCIDASGGFHVKTDIYCVHDYNHDVEKFKESYLPFKTSDNLFDLYKDKQKYKGEAVFLSEYGGITYAKNEGWGYGTAKSPEEFYALFKGLTNVLMEHPKFFGMCFTQLIDVEQERNGIYNYDRSEKFNVAPLKKVLKKVAEIEKSVD